MSLLTRCPACTTLYRVVPDQLRISQGWVKCGQCGDIFDASQHLIQASTAPEEAFVDSPGELPVTPPAEDITGIASQTPADPPGTGDQNCDSSVLESDFDLGSEPVLESDPTLDLAPEIQADADSSRQTDKEPDSLDQVATGSISESAVLSDLLNFRPSEEMTASDENALDRVSFLRGVDRKSFWHKPVARGVLSLMVVILGLGLVAQWAYRERDHLAAARPEWVPMLESMCEFLHCSVQAFVQIESLVIDSAGFKKLSGDSYRLSFTLRNLASLTLALPSIELTLTDSQDRAVVRRVLSPEELSATSDRLVAGAEWPVTVAVRVRTEAAAPTVLGYRLLAFYP